MSDLTKMTVEELRRTVRQETARAGHAGDCPFEKWRNLPWDQQWLPEPRCNCGFNYGLAALAELCRRAERQEEKPSCKWTEDDDGLWHTACGGVWFFDTGTPKENKACFCIYCGGSLDAHPFRVDPSDEKARDGASRQ